MLPGMRFLYFTDKFVSTAIILGQGHFFPDFKLYPQVRAPFPLLPKWQAKPLAVAGLRSRRTQIGSMPHFLLFPTRTSLNQECLSSPSPWQPTLMAKKVDFHTYGVKVSSLLVMILGLLCFYCCLFCLLATWVFFFF